MRTPNHYLLLATLSLGLAVNGSVSGSCSVSEKDVDEDGKIDQVIIENDWHRITFEPAAGGRAYSWLYKPLNKKFTTEYSRRSVFGDEVVEIATKWTRHPCKHAYSYEILQKGPKVVQLKIHAPLPLMRSFPDYNKVEIRRTYTLRSGSPKVEVDIEAFNGADKDLPFTLLVQHWVWVEDEACYFYCPDEMGVLMDIDEVTPHGSHPVGSQDPAAGWTGYISKSSKLGLTFVMDWKYLDAIEDWLSGRPSAAVQWPYLQQDIPSGKSWKTRYAVFPTVGMDALNWATEDLALGVTVGQSSGLGRNLPPEDLKVGAKLPIKLTLTGPAAGKVTVQASARLLPAEDPTDELGDQEVAFKPVEAATAQFEYTPKQQGTHVLSFTVKSGNNVVATFERQFNVGDTDQVYFAPRPKEEKVGRPNLGKLIIDPPLPDYCFRFDRSWKTPHIPWGRPHCRGTVRTLFISRAHYSVSHWREIWERGDIAFDHTVVAKSASGQPYPYRKNLLRDIMLKLNRRSEDVLFFAGLNWQIGFSKPLKEQIFSRIRKGLGAVILAKPDAKPNDQFYGDLAKFLATGKEVDASLLTDGMPFRHAVTKAYEIGEGRVVIIQGKPGYYEAVYHSGSLGDWDPAAFRPHVPGWEYGYGLFVKAIYWAAHRESPLVVRKVDAGPKEIKLTVENLSNETVFATALGTIYNRFYKPQARPETSAELRPGANALYFPTGTELSGGRHLLDVILRDNAGKSLAWGSAPFEVPSPVSASVKMDRPTSGYRPGDPIKALVSLNRTSLRPISLRVELRAIDAHGREAWLAKRSLTMVEKAAEITFDLSGLRRVTVLHDLYLKVFARDRLLAQDRHTFFVFWDRAPVYDDFKVGIYGGMSRDPLREQSTIRTLRELGIDEYYAYGDGGRYRDTAYRHGFFMITRQIGAVDLRPRGGPVKSEVDTDNLIVTPSLSDPEVFAKTEEAMKAHVKAASEVGGIDIYLLGDEWMWGAEFDYHPDSLSRFRDWLKKEYPSLSAMNQQWGTDFKDWDSVMPVKGRDMKEGGDLTNLSKWYDFRRYMTTVWTEYVRRPYEAAKSVNPRAAVGHEGVYPTGIRSGNDVWQFVKYCKVTGRYNSMLEEWYRSVDPEIIHGQYGGYGVDAPSAGKRFFPWRTLFHGGHWCFYYMLWDQAQPYQMIIDFDGSPHGGYPTIAREEWDDIKSGIGKLFIETKFTDDGIALPYSVASIYCSELLGTSNYGDLYNHKNIIQELGYQHTTYSMEQIASGELQEKGYKLLFLPTTLCLSAAEVKGIEAFVEAGGVVLANYGAGLRDEHGKTRAANPMDDLFGIDRSGVQGERRNLELSFAEDAPQSLQAAKPTMMPGEPGLKAKGGQAWARFSDGTAAVIVSKRGRGRAVYTNLDIGAYGSSKGAGVRGEVIVETRGADEYVRAVQAIFHEIFRMADVPRRVTITRDGKAFDSGETFYYSDDSGRPLYVGTMVNVAESGKVQVRFHQKAHLYDVRDRQYLGLTDAFEDEFHPGRIQVYAALPYRVTGLSLSIDRPNPEFVFGPGTDVSLTAQVQGAAGNPVLHVFRVEVYKPNGDLAEAYSKNHRAELGQLGLNIPLGYNAQTGTWKAVVTDIASQTRSAVSFEVGD